MIFELTLRDEPAAGLRHVLEKLGKTDRLAVFIGPEVGFSPEELQTGLDAGLLPASLGTRILRAETAAVVAVALSYTSCRMIQIVPFLPPPLLPGEGAVPASRAPRGEAPSRRSPSMNKLILAALSYPSPVLSRWLSTASSSSHFEGASVELILYTWTEVTEQAANQELIAEFEREHLGIKVRLQNVPGSKEAMQKLQTMMAAGTPPDVMSLHGAYYYPFASKGTLADLEPFIQQDPDFDLADFYPGLVKVSRWEGTLFSLPRYTSVYTLIYNQALFDAAGLAYPDPQKPWTWDEYLAAARKLTRNPETPTGSWGVYIDFWGSRVFPWLWQNNADLMNEDRSQCVIDSPEAIEALDFVRALRWEHRVAPTMQHRRAQRGAKHVSCRARWGCT